MSFIPPLQTVPDEGTQWYYQGRGALAHGDWTLALEAFTEAVPRLYTTTDWSLLWLCLLGQATTAWRTGDGLSAIQYAQQANEVSQYLAGGWPAAWARWLLGHLYAAHGNATQALESFIAAQHVLDTLDDYLMLGLTTAAAALCTEHRRGSQSLSEQLFGLLRLSFNRAQKQGLPLESLYGLPQPPLFAAVAPVERNGTERSALSRLRNFFIYEPAMPSTLPPPAVLPVHTNGNPDVEGGPLPDLRVYGLGRFDVLAGNTPVTQWNGTKSKTLLKLLVVAYPDPVPGPKLMQAMWPDVDEDLARQRLHTAVSDLRRALKAARPDASAFVVSQPGGYALDPQARIWLDVIEFNEAQRVGQNYELLKRIEEAQAAYARAVALYRGDFLEEDLYEDWPVEQRERIKSAYLEMLTRLGQWAFAAQDYQACLRWGEAALACDPCREDVHRQLMRCYSRLRQRPQALRQYQQCVKALRRDLDAVPETETEELYRRLQQGQEI